MFIGKYNYKKSFALFLISIILFLLFFDRFNEYSWSLIIQGALVIFIVYLVYKLSLRVKIEKDLIIDINGFKKRKFRRADYKEIKNQNGRVELIFDNDEKIVLYINNMTVVKDRSRIIGEKALESIVNELENQKITEKIKQKVF